MRTRSATWLAWSIFALSAACFGFGLLLWVLTPAQVLTNPVAFRLEALFAFGYLVYAAVGALIAARRPENPIGWLFGAIGLASEVRMLVIGYVFHIAAVAPGVLRAIESVAWLPVNLWYVAWGLAPLLVLLFPTGRLLSRRWRLVVWLTWASIVAGLLSSYVSLQAGSSTIDLPNPTALFGPEAGAAVKDALQSLSGLTVLVSYAFAATAMVVRLRRARGEERQQLKWFAFASVLMALVLIAESVIFFTPARRTLDPDAPYPAGLFLGVPFALALAIIPAAVGIAILKYRLYEIDIIIRRTLIYSALTGLLALIYFGSVVLLQQLFRAEGQSEIVTVISTLAIAALFTPLRRRIQNAIDRRFYRRKYDAAKTLAAFSATVRDETDLDKLTEQLVAVVQETMQPAHVSLWLKPMGTRQRIQDKAN